MASWEISSCSHLTNKQSQTIQWQSHQSVEVVDGLCCLLPPNIRMCSMRTLRHGESSHHFSKFISSLPYQWDVRLRQRLWAITLSETIASTDDPVVRGHLYSNTSRSNLVNTISHELFE